MSVSLQWFADADLTQPITDPLETTHLVTEPGQSVVHSVYLGSAEPDRRFRALSDPGVDPILLEVHDTAPSSG